MARSLRVGAGDTPGQVFVKLVEITGPDQLELALKSSELHGLFLHFDQCVFAPTGAISVLSFPMCPYQSNICT